MDDIQRHFSDGLSERGIVLSDDQLNQFEAYYRALIEWNEKMNLTGITDRAEVYVKHFFDSLSLAFYVKMGNISSLCDVGSGAGFPGIPLKIAFPHLKLTIVDSLNKRILFLQHVVDQSRLTDVQCVHGRAEDIARLPQHRDAYDLATARAVAKLSVLAEFCLPFVKVGGLFVAMKGSEVQDEVSESQFSLAELKGRWIHTERMELPEQAGGRHLIQIEKMGVTPKLYPRKAGTPLKQPLIKGNT
jgi:16S rRNA (guanine527-N7)-methyltransferase